MSNTVSSLFSPNPEDIHLKIVKIKKMWCPICIENMNERVILTECGHYYHRDCLIKYMAHKYISNKCKNIGCPYCNGNIKKALDDNLESFIEEYMNLLSIQNN